MQKEVYEKVGIDRVTYIRYESKRKKDYDLDILNRICEIIGTEPNKIYDEYMAFIAGDYGITIREFREKHNLSCTELGTLLGLHSRVPLRWEGGISKPSRRSFEKLKEFIESIN